MRVTDNENFLCIAHRGAMGTEPENTIRSFRKALEMGANWVELDVHYIHNTLFVIHDDEVELPAYGKAKLNELDIDQIRNIDIKFQNKTDKIPTLDEVLRLINKKANINIELKGRNTAKPVCDLINKYVSDFNWTYENFLLSSFLFSELVEVFKREEPLQLGYLIKEMRDDLFERLKSIEASYLNVSKEVFEKHHSELSDKSCSEGIKILVYTINERDDVLRIKDQGAGGVFTNYVDRCKLCL